MVLQEAGFRLIGHAEDEQSLHQLAVQHKPDIVLFDWEISEDRMSPVRRLSKDIPGSILIILTRPQSGGTFVEATREGVKGYLSVNLSPQEFLQALSLVLKGDIVVSRDMVSEVRKELISARPPKSPGELSDREREVLTLVGEGATNREIARRLFVSEHTVKVHVRNILGKLNLRNRQQAAAYAAQKGLVSNINHVENISKSSS